MENQKEVKVEIIHQQLKASRRCCHKYQVNKLYQLPFFQCIFNETPIRRKICYQMFKLFTRMTFIFTIKSLTYAVRIIQGKGTSEGHFSAHFSLDLPQNQKIEKF